MCVIGGRRPERLARCHRDRSDANMQPACSSVDDSLRRCILSGLIRRRKKLYTCYVYEVPRASGGAKDALGYAVRRVRPRDLAENARGLGGRLRCDGFLTMYSKGRGQKTLYYSGSEKGGGLFLAPLGPRYGRLVRCSLDNGVRTTRAVPSGRSEGRLSCRLGSVLGLGSNGSLGTGEGDTLSNVLSMLRGRRGSRSIRRYEEGLERLRAPENRGIRCIKVLVF